jgi:hypothetical protein
LAFHFLPGSQFLRLVYVIIFVLFSPKDLCFTQSLLSADSKLVKALRAVETSCMFSITA